MAYDRNSQNYGGFSWSNNVPTGSFSDLIGRIGNNFSGASANNEFNASEAEKQFLRTKELQELAYVQNSALAKADRDWQEMMSNTAYQRGVNDMKAAGLNPAAIGANPASTPSGASGSVNAGSAAAAHSSGPGHTSVLGILAKVAQIAIMKGAMSKMSNTATAAAKGGSSVTKAVTKAAKSEIASARSAQDILREQMEKDVLKNRRRWNVEHGFPKDW